jgi:beta-barrel assembly-enhancing protease
MESSLHYLVNMRKLLCLAIVALSLGAAGFAPAQVKDLKPGFNLFSSQQDIQLGQEAATQVQQEQAVVQNAQLTDYLNSLVGRLANTTHGRSEFPYKTSAIASKDINAFALPGGPIFVYTTLINEASNEAELAGVLAHEMTHVKLRHGTSQATEANLIQLPFALAEKAVGSGSLLGQLTQLGIGLGFNSVILKMSRGHESEADYNGALTMAEAGYNPMAMAQFFQKLEAKGGSETRLTQFLSDHPNPGNRVKAVQDEIRQMPARTYTTDSGQFPVIKRLVSTIPVPPPKTPISQNR